MKVNCLALIVLLGLLVFTVGCVTPLGAPVFGGIVTSDVKGPVAVGDPNVQPAKVGMSKAEGYVVFATGDASIEAAMKNGDITKIHHVDCKVFSVLGLYCKYETLVYGE